MTWFIIGVVWVCAIVFLLRWNHVISKRNKEFDEAFKIWAEKWKGK